jgi:hypothetical protein
MIRFSLHYVPRGPDATEGYVKTLTELKSGADILGWGGGTPVLIDYSIETVVHHRQCFYLTIQLEYKCKTDSTTTNNK